MSELSGKLLRAARHPLRTVRRVLGMDPGDGAEHKERLFLRYGELARQQGFDRLYVALSFDCDTPEAAAAERLDAWLRGRGLKASYAVPGATLRQGAEVYRRIAGAGAEFMNHGMRPHTEWRDGRYWSATFYDRMTPDEVREDIRCGHETVLEIIGRAPVGFRAPHFGSFQSSEQRELIYETLRPLGYVYASSTLPALGLENGPLVDVGGMVELPLSGSYAAPQSILDSWAYVESPYRPVVRDEYAALFVETVDQLLSLRVPGLLNYYVDPPHVHQSSAFSGALEHLLIRGIRTLELREIMEKRRR